MEKEKEQSMSDVIKAIENDYFPHLISSYSTWQTGPSAGWVTDEAIAKRITEFAEGLSYKKGRNYVKIITGRGGHQTVHSFIVLKATKGFEVGDILKAAGWAAPATNFKRGNVLCPALFGQISWTGAG